MRRRLQHAAVAAGQELARLISRREFFDWTLRCGSEWRALAWTDRYPGDA